jgi:ligand-binding sensor domain-containing protein/signal transduction histidine kinase
MSQVCTRVVFSLALLACCACAFASDPSLDNASLHFSHLSSADGLSHADVRAIAQDHQGFMWFGTWLGGLNRYDGYTFKVYKHDDQDERSLNNDTVRTLFVDHTGVLWISTNGPGLERYDRDTDSFTHFRHDPHDADSLPDNNVKAFFEDETGTMWVGTQAGLSRFDRSSGKFFTYRARPDDPASFGETHVKSIGLDANTGLLWVGTEDAGVRVLDRSTGHFTSYAHDPNDPASLSVDEVSHIFQDRAGAMWLSTPGGLNRFDSRTHRFVRYLHDPRNPNSLSDSSVLETYEDRAGRFWAATNTGLDLMDRSRETFAHLVHNPSDPSSRSSNIVNYEALCEDTSGALWIGTRSTGVDRLVSDPPKFTTYRHNSEDAKSLSDNAVNGLAIGSGGELWIGTETGLYRFDGKAFSHYNPNDPSSLSSGPQRVVAQDARGVVWTATYGGGLDRLDGQRFTHFRHDPKNPDSLADDAISSLVPDPKKGLWIGVHAKGLDYFDGQHFTHFTPEPKNPAGLLTHLVTPVLLDRSGVLWIATIDMGLVRFDTNSHKFTTYLMDPAHPGSQAANWTQDIYSDGTDLWVASSTGLFRFDPETGRFTRRYTERDGLPNNSVVGILGDARGNLWLSTVKGLSKFDPKAETFRNYDAFDGLQGDQFTILSRAKGPDGRLFFGGVNGLSAFYPDKLVDNPNLPPVVLTEFELFNEPAKIHGKNSPLQQAINVSSNITLGHDQSVFRFQFAALDFTAPQKNRYAYKLEGFDKDWQYADAKRRFATYTNLDPGDYTFRVKASNNDGVWNEQGVSLHIRILPPWWNTQLFRALCMAAFMLLLWGFYRLRLRQLAQQFNVRLEERVSERTRIARELHDTLLQSFQGLMLRFQTVDEMLPARPTDAKKALEGALDRADEALIEGRDAITDMRISTWVGHDLEKSMKALMTELNKELVTGGQETATFSVLVEGAPKTVPPTLRDEIYRIAREALRNAFRHADARRIETEITYGERLLRVRFRDDGKGIDPNVLEHGGRSGHWGLPGLRERAKHIGAQLVVWSELGAGTEVELSIPASIAYETSTTRIGFPIFRKKTEHDHEPRT